MSPRRLDAVDVEVEVADVGEGEHGVEVAFHFRTFGLPSGTRSRSTGRRRCIHSVWWMRWVIESAT